MNRPRYCGLVRPLGLLLAAALCALVATGCGGGASESTATATPAPAPAETEVPATAPAREHAPAIEGTSLDGEPISLADYRGRAVLVNVWSSW